MTSCCAPRPSQWCIIVCCCKHPRLEAVPAPAFSQMFAAPGYAWTTAEGEAVVNTCAFIFVKQRFYRQRWISSPWIILAGRCDLLKSSLKWRSKAGVWVAQSWALCCFVTWTTRLGFLGMTSGGKLLQLPIALSIVCFSSFCYLGLWRQIIINAGKYLAGLCTYLLCLAFCCFL